MWKLIHVEKWSKFWYRIALWETVYNISWKKKVRFEKCKCKCWKIMLVRFDHLYHWRTISCWCNNLKSNIYKILKKYSYKLYWLLNSKRHGMVNTVFYSKYQHAKARCENPNCERYKSYWWRWINIERRTFEEFKNDMYESYLKHCDEYWEEDTTLDRINVNWNYCKNNCRWATRYEQMNNTQKSKKIIYMWIEYSSISDLCHKIWRYADRAMIDSRIRRWMTVEDAILKPNKKNVKTYKNINTPFNTNGCLMT